MKSQSSGNDACSLLGLKSDTHTHVFIQTPHVSMFGVSECDNTYVAMNTTIPSFAHVSPKSECDVSFSECSNFLLP